MGTIAISALDIGAMLVGGLIAKFLPKVVSDKTAGKKCCSGEEAALIVVKIDELMADLQKIRDAVTSA